MRKLLIVLFSLMAFSAANAQWSAKARQVQVRTNDHWILGSVVDTNVPPYSPSNSSQAVFEWIDDNWFNFTNYSLTWDDNTTQSFWDVEIRNDLIYPVNNFFVGSNLYVGNNTRITNDLWVGGEFDVEGDARFGADVYIASNLYVSGTGYFDSVYVSNGLTATNGPVELGTNTTIGGETIDDFVKARGVPVGTVISSFATNAPEGYLYCDGTSYETTAYADLFAAIGTSCGSTNASWFNVPDLRGQFIRGQDDGVGLDPDAGSRTEMATGGNTGDAVGSIQDDDFLQHNHQGYPYTPSGNGHPSGADASSLENSVNTSTGNRGGNETRPVNVSVRYYIKY